MVWNLSGTTLTQTGTDTDLSGLSAINGVTTHSFLRSIYHIDDSQISTINIEGNLSWEPDEECLIQAPNARARISGTVNFGSVKTANNIEYKSFSVGWVSYRTSNDGITFLNNSTFNGFGGIIELGQYLFVGSSTNASNIVNFTANGTTFRSISPSTRQDEQILRMFANGDNIDLIDIKVIGTQTTAATLFSAGGYNTLTGTFLGVTFQSDGTGVRDIVEARNIDLTNNFSSFDFRATQPGGDQNNMNLYRFIDSSAGSNIRVYLPQRIAQTESHSTWSLGAFNNGSPVENAYVYTDFNGSNRNPEGRYSSLNYTTPRTHTVTTSSNGYTNEEQSLIGLCQAYTSDNLAVNSIAPIESLTTQSDDVQDFYIYSYGYNLIATQIDLKGINTKKANYNLVVNNDISESNKTTVSEYTGINIDHNTTTITISQNRTLDELYDFIALDKESNLRQPTLADLCVEVNETTLNFSAQSYSIVVNNNAVLSSGNKFNTIDSDNINTDNGTITARYINNDGNVNIIVNNINPNNFPLTVNYPASVLYKLTDATTWSRVSSHDSSFISFSVTPNTVYDIRVRVTGYEWIETTINSGDFGQQVDYNLQAITDLNNNALFTSNFDTSKLSTIVYHPVDLVVNIVNTGTELLEIDFITAFQQFERILHNTSLVGLWTNNIIPNSTSNGFIVPENNLLQVWLSDSSTANVRLLFTAKYQDGTDALDRFHGNDSGFQINIANDVVSVSVTIPSAEQNATAVWESDSKNAVIQDIKNHTTNVSQI